MGQSIKSRRNSKSPQSAKPYPEFPLTAHPSGRWCKKHRGRQYYFGPIENWQSALERYHREWPYIIDGRSPPPVDVGEHCTIRDLANSFLTEKRSKLDSGELATSSFDDYHRTCRNLVDHFGKVRRVDDLRPDDFRRCRSELAQRLGTTSLKNEINRARIIFKYAFDTRLIDQPVNFGQSFDKPSAKMIRKARNDAGQRMFESHEVRATLDAVDDPQLKAMILLGMNAGFGNTDCSDFPRSAIEFDTGWIEFPRPKTEVNRRVPMWPETTEALKAAIDCRPNPKDEADADCCFVTIQGNRWTRIKRGIADSSRFSKVDTVGNHFRSLLKSLGINGRHRSEERRVGKECRSRWSPYH